MNLKQMTDAELREAWIYAYVESIKNDPEKLLQLLQVVEEHIASREEQGPGGPVYSEGAIT